MRGPKPPVSVLVIDDEPNHAATLAEILEGEGFEVTTATSGERGLKTLSVQPFDIVVTDLVMHPVDGMDVLREAKANHPGTEVILVSGQGSVDQAVKAIKEGAANYLTKPLELAEVREKVGEVARRIRGERDPRTRMTGARHAESANSDPDFPEIVGRSKALRRILDVVRKVAPTPVPVLITGSNGTGKELIARAIHRLSPRRDRPFVALNCGALPESTIESELFGHVKGAFTGAEKTREGRIEYANEGTLFLDEIGEMSVGMQVKLLRVLEQGEIVPVGANEAKHVNVRILAATNRNPEDEIAKGNFREDLFYRLRGVQIHVPDLKDRREDIPLLLNHFLEEANRNLGTRVEGFTEECLDRLVNYEWPGNIRQLKNVVTNMVLMAGEGMLTPEDLPDEILGASARSHALVTMDTLEGLSLSKIEEYMIRHYLERFEGNRAKVAGALGISERTLYRKLKEYGINP